MMKAIASGLESIIDRHLQALRSLPEDKFALKPSPSKWSKKELIGHLIDSAQSNIRRFVIAQYEESPTIKYNQDKWVAINGYQQWDSNNLIDLWYLLNKQICSILRNSSPEMAQRTCQTEEMHTVEWLAQDYLKHLEHHLHRVLELEPVDYR